MQIALYASVFLLGALVAWIGFLVFIAWATRDIEFGDRRMEH